MEVIFEGLLSHDNDTAAMLQKILKQKAVSQGILRITCSETPLNGRLVISDGRFVTAARTNNGQVDVAAVKALLSINNGSFAYLDVTGKLAEEGTRAFLLSLERLFEILPNIKSVPEEVLNSLSAEASNAQAGETASSVKEVEQSSKSSANESIKDLSEAVDSSALAASSSLKHPKVSLRFAKIRRWEENSRRWMGIFFGSLFITLCILLFMMVRLSKPFP